MIVVVMIVFWKKELMLCVLGLLVLSSMFFVVWVVRICFWIYVSGIGVLLIRLSV